MDIVDARHEDRYTVTTRLEGTLAGVDVVIEDLGLHGARVRHRTPIRLGTNGKLSFAVEDTGEAKLPGFVVWSRLATKPEADGTRAYYSGVRLDDPDEKMASLIGQLLNRSIVKPDNESIERKKKALQARERSRQQPGVKFFGANVPRVPDDVILLVKQTRERLQSNPAETVKWLNRAKFSIDEAGVQIRHRDDVLAVWEYLERSIEIDIIARVLDSK